MQVLKGLSYKEYSKMEGLSNSMLSKIVISPAHYKTSLDEPEKETDALKFGSLLHCLVLEPDKLQTDFAIEPIGINKRTNKGKVVLEQFYLQNAEKTIITTEQLQLALRLQTEIMKHEIANKLLTGKGENEISLFWEDDETHIICKGKLDRIKNDIIIDLKTVRSAKPEDFQKAVYEFDYYKQAYWYSTGFAKCFNKKPKGVVFIAVEKEPPYSVAVYEISELFKEIGEIEARKNLITYADCLEKNNFYGYDGKKPVIHALEPPQWVLNKYIDELGLELED